MLPFLQHLLNEEMDKWGARARAPEEEKEGPPAAKHRALFGAAAGAAEAGGGGGGVSKRAWDLTSRLSLQNAANMRMIMGILLLTLLIPKAAPCCEAMVACRKEYSDLTKGKKGHKQGRPEQWLWGKLVWTVACDLKKRADDVSQQAFKTLEDYLGRHPDPSDFSKAIQACQISECFEGGLMRITLRIEGDEGGVAKIVIDYMCDVWSAKDSPGSGPRGYMERALQDEVDKRSPKKKS